MTDPNHDSANPTEAASDSQTVEQQLQAALAERDAAQERWLRSVAELENFRKRMQREADETRRYSALSVVRDILGPLDNLFRAVTAARQAAGRSGPELQKSLEELTTGVEMVAKQFDAALATHHAVPIDPVGKPFDPNLHEAIAQAPSPDAEPGTVLQEVERGYRMHDRVIRPSRVIVATAPQ